MDVSRLARLVSEPEIHREVLRRYQGPYSLGVTRLNNDDKNGALRLRVENGRTWDFPAQIEIQGEEVPILVDVNWAPPKPQGELAPAKS